MNDLERIVRIARGKWPHSQAESVTLSGGVLGISPSPPCAGWYSRKQYDHQCALLREQWLADTSSGAGPSFEEWLKMGLESEPSSGYEFIDAEAEQPQPAHKYQRLLRPTLPQNKSRAPIVVDVYDFIDAYEVTDGELQHALKKIVMPGRRGHKSLMQDLQDIIDSVERMKQRLATRHD